MWIGELSLLDKIPCRPETIYRHYGGPVASNVTVCYVSNKSLLCHLTLHHIPEDIILNLQRCKKLQNRSKD